MSKGVGWSGAFCPNEYTGFCGFGKNNSVFFERNG